MMIDHCIATPADVPALHDLVESAYRGERSKAGWTSEADLLGGQRTDPRMLARVIADTAQAILVFKDEDGIKGCVTVEQRADHGYIGMVSVRPTAQGAGLGRAMLNAAETHLVREWGMARARMTVIAQRDTLIAWYERRGYVLTGDTAPFPYGDPQFGTPKRDDLYFVILEKQLS
jgi:ribosomal protein S18 acetylase RimI-like enzyme